MSAPYPLSALVGADELRLALILNAVSPAIGGVLVRGEKGTAKSTAVRGLAALLPETEVVAGCPFSCHPESPDPLCPAGPHRGAEAESRPPRLIELPVGASEDRVTGSLDLERALTEGLRAFQPGLLADAHRGVLYVDEVNLLGDHLVDLLLDAAAMGFNIVEREGISVRHASRFQLIGTMNPEEGELRPQLLDRFGLTVEVRASREPAERAEVVRRRLDYEADPDGFARRWADADADVAGRIAAARKLVAEVVLGERALAAVVAACSAFEVDGMRADIVTAKAACALAAWEGRGEVTVADVRAAALLALPHRRRRGPFESPGIDEAALDEALRGLDDGPDDDGPDDQGPGGRGPQRPGDSDSGRGSEPAPEPGGQPSPPTERPDKDDRSGKKSPADGGSERVACDADHMRAQTHATSEERVGESPDGEGRQPSAQPITLPAGAMFDPVLLQVPGAGAGALGRRSPADSDRGRHSGDRLPRGPLRDLAIGATLRAAAAHQRERRPAQSPDEAARARRPASSPGAAGWLPVPSPGAAGRFPVPSPEAVGRFPVPSPEAVGSRSASSPDVASRRLGASERADGADCTQPGPAHARPAGPAHAPPRRAGGVALRPWDLREKVRDGREGNLVLFVVDASGSMAARRRMTAVKGAALSLLVDAYQRRDRIGLIAFRGERADVAVPPTASVEFAARLLERLPTGGRTPLAAGLERAAEVLAVERVRDPRRRPLLVLLTDGRATSAGGIPAAETAAAGLAARGVAAVVVDTEDATVRLGLAGRVARALGAPWLRLEDLAAGSLAGVVRGMTASLAGGDLRRAGGDGRRAGGDGRRAGGDPRRAGGTGAAPRPTDQGRAA